MSHFLYWLEALSLIGRLPESIDMIDNLLVIVDVSRTVTLNATIY
jgi:hypothetical protein